MNRPIPDININNIDPQLVSASLCYLITLYAKGHSDNLSQVVMRHLKILIGLDESISPEAVATYRKLLNVWEVTEKQKSMQSAMECSCNKTVH
jgi:hypothetical protein